MLDKQKREEVFMSVEAMLTLDLHTASALQRGAFYDHLRDNGWNKLPDVDTAWYKRFGALTAISTIESSIQNDINRAAASCNCQYDSWYLIGIGGGIITAFSNRHHRAQGTAQPIMGILGSQ
ncbi:hypothetical protein RA813_002428 [Vibrio parahaemolyticus]|nr:hypothetical protein [Vibrio parahaemolyticus]EJU9123925.1 hypothetical protein [Vibrio parahaemolyticus]ELA7027587.1 hypothetical protein [Vibrio parahaemolyticus]